MYASWSSSVRFSVTASGWVARYREEMYALQIVASGEMWDHWHHEQLVTENLSEIGRDWATEIFANEVSQ